MIVVLMLATGCNNEIENQQGRIIVDAMGREVHVPEKINKIVATGSAPRMIAYMGLEEKVVGFSGLDWENITPMTAYAYTKKDVWEDLPIVGSDAYGNTEYYPESIIEVDPDVIFTTWSEEIANEIETKTNIPVIILPEGTLFGDDYDEALRLIGEACYEEERAEEVINYIDSILNDLDNRTKNIPDNDKPTVISAAATYNGPKGIDGIRPNDPVLKALNAKNLAYNEEYGNKLGVQVDKEQILIWDPEYIFCDYEGVPLVLQDYEKNEEYYKELKAFENQKIYQHPSSTSYFTNVELPLCTGYFIGKILYPEEFSDIDIDEKVDEIVEFMLGAEGYSEVLKEYGGYYEEIDFEK